jgi:hypothetical protein
VGGRDEDMMSNKKSARAALPPHLLLGGGKIHESMDHAVYKPQTSGDYSGEYDTSIRTAF